MPLGYHLMIRLQDDRVLAPNPSDRRKLAVAVLRAARSSRLLSFGAADNHLHAAVVGDRREAGELARRIEIALHHRLHLPVCFERARLKAIVDQHHLASTFRYALSQERHHGTALDPLFDATNLPDLLGLRVVGGYTGEHVRSYLPRVGRAALLELLGFPALDTVAVAGRDWQRDLADAAAGAFGLVDLAGRSNAAREARRAASHVMRRAASVASIAAALRVEERTVYRLLAGPASADAARAVALQLQLRALLRTAAERAACAISAAPPKREPAHLTQVARMNRSTGDASGLRAPSAP